MSLPAYHLRLFGCPRIGTEDVEAANVALWRHPLALAAILAAEAGGPLTRDKLVALLWPEADTGRARNRLWVALHALRQALGPTAIVSVGDGLRLDVSRVRCDVVEFVRALDAGEPAFAVQVYGGAFLDGFHLPDSLEFDQWAEGQRDRFAALYAGALEAVAERHAAAGDWAAAAASWRRRAEQEPSSGRVIVRLMDVLERTGNRAAALREAERHGRLMREEFDSEAAPEVRALAGRIRAGPDVPEVSALAERIHSDSDTPEITRPAAAANTPVDAQTSAPTASGAPAVGISQAPARPSHRGFRRRRLYAGLAAVIVAGVVIAWVWSERRASAAGTLDPDAVAVLPFRVTAPDSAYNYLREGAVDLLNAYLTGDGVPRAVDSRTTISRWRRAVEASDGDGLPRREELALARGFGAGHLLLGDLLVSPSRIAVSGRLLRVPDGALVAEAVETARAGEVDEVVLVERMVGQLIARARGEHAGRIGPLSDSLSAVKAYLAGRRAHRRVDWSGAVTHYREALATDSMFTAAAFAYRIACDWGGEYACVVDAARRVWLTRDSMSTRDRAVADMLIGRDYPRRYASVPTLPWLRCYAGWSRTGSTTPLPCLAPRPSSVRRNGSAWRCPISICSWLIRSMGSMV